MEIRTVIVGPLAVNCYIIIDETTRAAAIIDPGDDVDDVVRAITGCNANPKYILLTHGHPDHSWRAGELQKTYNVDLRMHEADVPQLEGEPDMVAMFYGTEVRSEPGLGRFLSDGDVIQLGDTEIRVIHTPGHSEGGLCFTVDGVAFTGDTLFAGSIGRTDFMGGSHEDLMNSIKKKLFALPDETIIYPGHGPTSTIGQERHGNPWLL
jgi:hydroxyacylglutathione hydrolase